MIEKEKKNNKFKIVLILVAVLLIGGFIYFNSPKNIFLRVINKGYNNIIENLVSNVDKSGKNIKTGGNLTFDFKMNELYKNSFDISLIDEINKLELELNSEISAKTKEFMYELNTKYDSNNLLGFAIYGKEKNIYLELKEIFDKYIEITIDNYDELFEDYDKTLEESGYLIGQFKNSLLKNLNSRDFKKSKTTLKTDDKEFKVNKIEYKINEKSAAKLMLNVFKDLKKDKKFIKNLAKLSETEEKKITDSLNSLIEELGSVTEFDTETFISISLYTKGFLYEYVGFEFNINNEVKLDYYNYNDDSYGNLDIGGEISTIKCKKQKENESKIEININGIVIDVLAKEKDKKYDYSYKLDIDGMIIEGEMNFDLSEEEKDKKYNNDFDFSIKLKYDDQELIYFATKYDGSTEILDESFTNLTTKDVVNIEELTETDINTIYTNITNNQNIIKFITNIQNALSEENEVNY